MGQVEAVSNVEFSRSPALRHALPKLKQIVRILLLLAMRPHTPNKEMSVKAC